MRIVVVIIIKTIGKEVFDLYEIYINYYADSHGRDSDSDSSDESGYDGENAVEDQEYIMRRTICKIILSLVMEFLKTIIYIIIY